MTKTIWTMTLATILLAGLVAPAFTNNAYATPTLLGPSEYFEFADSPFFGTDFSSGYFHLEDFEDGLFDSPGVSATGSGLCLVSIDCYINTPYTDSVDVDDGIIDGSGQDGVSHFSTGTGITYTFDEVELGNLPTHVGIVWTDGSSTVTFRAFDYGGNEIVSDTSYSATGPYTGQTDEDRFYGVIDADGIKSIFIDNARAGTEADHLQYGFILTIQEVVIDVKPGSDPSSVSCKNDKGVVPVAIFGSESFDASTIDIELVSMNLVGSAPVIVTEAHEKLHLEDINGDGFDDAVLHLEKAGVCDATEDAPKKQSVDVILSGESSEGSFEGLGDIRVVN